MKIEEIIKELQSHNVTPKLEQEQLKLVGATDQLSKEFIAALKEHKHTLIDFLKESSKRLSYASIDKIAEQQHYPLSGAQKRIWILNQFEGAAAAYNIISSFYLKGKVNASHLNKAFKTIIDKHESLRTIFKEADGEVRQFILNKIDFKIQEEDLTGQFAINSLLEAEVDRITNAPFQLDKGPLLQVRLIKISKTEYALLLSIHHIISDGWSIGILIKEVMEAYSAYCLDQDLPAATLSVQYKSYAHWLEHKFKGQIGERYRNYWTSRLADVAEPLQLPADFSRPAVKSYSGALSKFYFDKALYAKTQDYCKANGTTLFSFLHTALTVLLYNYSGQRKITIGAPVAGRNHADLENQIGLYVNTIALQTAINPEQSFSDYLKQTTTQSLQDFEYQDYPFDKVVEDLNIARDMARNTLFDVMIVLQNAAYGDGSRNVTDYHDFKLSFLDTYLYTKSQPKQKKVASKFDLTFNFLIEPGNHFCFELEYNTDLFKAATAEQLALHFQQLLSSILKQPELPVGRLMFLNAAEKEKLLVTFNDSAKPYPKDKTIVSLFENQVTKTPDAVAITFRKDSLTYKELNEKANQLAHYLRKTYTIKANDLIAIKLERTEWLIISILAALKSGAAYVPIDPLYPQERIDYMLSDSRSKVLIDDGELEKFKNETKKYTIDNLKPVSKAGNLVYVIYTSGSTGRPKGVMIRQRAFTNLVNWYAQVLELKEQDNVLLIAPVSFDLAQKNIFAPLITGASLCLPAESHNDYESLIRTIATDQVSVIGCAPSAFYPLLDESVNDAYKKLTTVKKIALGGEPIVISKFLPWVRSGIFHGELINTYGPTEGTDIVSYYRVKEEDWNTLKTIPIGKPVDNVKLHVLNDSFGLVPIGAEGEIFIAGISVGLGYLNKPELTAERFVANPFEKGQKMFRTGDLGKRLTNGNIEFTGRKDDQVKIRGFRVELGEIENAIRTAAAVDSVVVAAKATSTGEKELVAYIVSTAALNASILIDYLSGVIPAYMIPSHFVQLDALPLTPSGKIDRKRLPNPEGLGMSTGIAYVAPTNAIEEQLISIWEELLGREKIGIKDDFFKAGGHSLKAMRLTSQIHRAFDVRVELKTVFANPVLDQQARLIAQSQKTTYQQIPTAAVQDTYPLSAAQRRLWILDQLEEHSTSYNMPGVYVMEGVLDVERLERTFQALVLRQESLRTSFEMRNGEVVQIIHPEIDFSITRLEAADFSANAFSQPFDLSKAPLFRVNVISENEQQHLLAVDMHHIISDGVSVGMLIQEFTELYNGNVLKPLKIQYKDFANWQQTFLESEQMQQQAECWLSRFSDQVPSLELPIDFSRPLMPHVEGATLHFNLEENSLNKLKVIAAETGTTVYMLLFSTYSVLLSKYSGQDDIVIGTPVAGRPHADLEHLIGMFVNTLAIRNHPKADKTFHAFLLEVKNDLLTAFDNQDFPFEELVERLQLKRDVSRNPLFDVMFSYQNSNKLHAFEIEGMQLKQVITERRISKFDLSLDVIENENKLELSMEYATGIFKKESIERLIAHFKKIISELTENLYVPIAAMDMLTRQEKYQLLSVYNNTHVNYSSNKTILDLFEEQVEATPVNIALSFENNALTYKQLNERSNQVARVLESKGVSKGSIVGVMTEPGFEMIIGLLAILKTGAAYLPIDIHYPAERIDFMLTDCSVKLVLVNGTTPAFNSGIESIDLRNKKWYAGSKANLKSGIKNNDLAYVTYTSGSTGRPKGVMVEHSNLFDYVSTFIQLVGVTADDTTLLNSSISFDTAIEELFPALCVSGKVLINKDNQDLEKVMDLIANKKITILSTSPLAIHYINEEAKKFGILRVLISGGDVLKPSYITNIPSCVTVYNSYGPTESTVCITYHKIEEVTDKNIPIGKPIANRQVYILDAHLNLVPAGIPGELCVGGKGIARGYLNREALTNEKFVPNPFVKGERMYRTGDLAKWLPDGTIEFMGRLDQQVKIRGFRIELGEIESKLQELSEITQALVIAKEDTNGNNYLCAYFVAEETIDGALIREFLRTQLPEFMIPAFFIQINSVPMTLNGKVDKKALPSPEQSLISVVYTAARNKAEEQLVTIWEQLLDRKKISMTADFFSIGGHSLTAMRLLSQIHSCFGVKLELRSIFANPTLEQQAQLIQQSKETAYHAIPVVATQTDYPLSSAQRRLWILSQFEEGNVAYNMPGVFVIEGHLNKLVLADAFNALITRHEILRTVFKENEKGELRQFVQPAEEVTFTISYEDLRTGNKQQQLKEAIDSATGTAFDLSTGPLLHVNLYQLSDQQWIFVYVMHHIISDGWSMDILIREVLAIYNATIKKEMTSLAPMRIHYKDYASWQQQQLTGADMDAHRSYWLKKMQGPLPILELQGDHVRPSVKTYNGGIIHKQINAALLTQLKAIAQQQGSTLFMGLLAAVNALLYKYTSQEDIIIGTPAAGREHADLEDQIGFYINTLALRTQLKGATSYAELLSQTKQLTLEAYEHQLYPFDELVDALKPGRDISRSALFDVMIVLQNTNELKSTVQPQAEGFTLKPYDGETTQLSKFDLLFDFAEQEGVLQLNLEYNSNIYNKETITRLADHFEQLLQVLIVQPEQPINQLEFISAKEKEILLTTFNHTAAAYPADKTIVELFEEQVAKHPDKIALAFQEKEFNYHGLNAEANQLGAYLRNKYHIKADDLIIVKLERSEWMMIAILAVLKSGGAYVPVDPTYPQDRIDYMIEDSGSKVVIDEEVLENFRKKKNNYPDTNLSLLHTPGSLVYVIYTSGSTGRPKGCMLENKGVVNRIEWMWKHYDFNAQDVILQKTTCTFDVSVWEIFMPLCWGTKMVLCEKQDIGSPELLMQLIHRHQVTCLHFVPSMFNVFITALQEGVANKHLLTSLTKVMTSGEALAVETVKKWYEQINVPIHNLYGPTEASVDVTYYTTSAEDTRIPIGKPIWNTQMYVLNERMQVLPIGIAGEIYIGGDGLARGYLNKKELTAEKFVPHPFKKKERIYKTGDIGRWLADGNIEYIGRKDDQVKIRGYRIELGEIENALQSHAAVESSVVIAKANASGEKELIAYIVGKTTLSSQELRAHLSKQLPAYMIPGYYLQLETLPLTSSGKVDRKQLPSPQGLNMSTGVEYLAPRNETEIKLVSIWEQLLDRKKIGVLDDFFALGGHSLKATQLLSQVHRIFQVKLDLRDLFINTTPELQAQLIAKCEHTNYLSIERSVVQNEYALSSAQKRLFFLQQLSLESTSYNMPYIDFLGKNVDKERIQGALKELVKRHESFRTYFESKDGIVRQKIQEFVAFELEERRCSLTELDAQLNACIRAFDLGKAPLLRSCLIDVQDIGYVWIIDMHHIISDGTSNQVLIDDFIHLYKGEPLPELRLQYRDFSEWQNAGIENGEFERQKKYWLEKFTDGIPVLNFPTDHARPASFNFEGAEHEFVIDVALTAQLKEFNKYHQSTMQMTLLSVLNVLLYKYSGQEDVIIGCGIAGRRHADVEHIVGMFVNTLAIKSAPSGNKKFIDFYKEVVSNCIGAYENQDIQFEDLVDTLNVERDASRNPIFDIGLVVQNMARSKNELNALFGSESSTAIDGVISQWKNSGTAKFDMTWFVTERTEDIVFNLEYYSAVFNRSTIEQLARHFITILKIIVATPEVQISAINMLSDNEAQQLLAFNSYMNTGESFYPVDATFHALFEKQCILTPDDIAITDRNISYSYRELNERSNQLAQFLIYTTNIQPEDKVGVLQSRSMELMISILGILKSGGTYVPLDGKHPEGRLLYMLEDAAISILLTEKNVIEFANRLQWRSKGLKHLVCVDSEDMYHEQGLWKNDMMRKDLWDHVGNTATDAITGGGWMSSYTGEYLSELEMSEYSRNAYLKLKPHLHKEMKVLEIGCSSGLTMFEIAKEVGTYHGTDLSSTIIENTGRVAKEKGFTNITLSCLPAHDIDQVPETDFDLVIVNSVIQSFHGHNYLRDVLVKAMGRMKPTGLFFIGDIMDEDRREVLIQDLLDFKKSNQNEAYRTKTDLSSELFVSRDYLNDLIADNIGFVSADYSEKIYTLENELTRFRFDALLKKDQDATLTNVSKKKYQHDLKEIRVFTTAVPEERISNTNLAYVIYTSGSTGLPKGVMIEHRSIVSFFESCRKKFSFNEKISTPLLASHAFDISLFESFLPLFTGGTVLIFDEEYVKDSAFLANELKKVNAFHAVPALMGQIVNYISTSNTKKAYTHIKDLFIGGDAVPTVVLEEMRTVFPDARIHTLYGPTESTLFITTKHYLNGQENNFQGSLIGSPNSNARIYITDEHQHLLPLGAIGEVCVSGKAVARGYLNNTALTAEKFLADPFHKNERLYRTGDLAKWNVKGELEFAGRTDSQVKVRGFRIELGEIEKNLEALEGVNRAIVLPAKDADGTNFLVAYVEKKKTDADTSKEVISANVLRNYLKDKLPEYMVPASFIVLDELPLSSNKKIDRKALAKLGTEETYLNKEIVAPRNAIEEQLVGIWKELLGREQLSVTDNFFHVGGHSLKATRLAGHIHKVFDVKIELKDLFLKPLLEQQAKLIQQSGKITYTTIPAVPIADSYPLSSSQRRLWILSQFEEGTIAYNMPGVYILDGQLNLNALQNAFASLIDRHESLRTVFKEEETGEVKQFIQTVLHTGFKIDYEDLRGETEQGKKTTEFIQAGFAAPFDLGKGPLIRAAVYQLTDTQWIFMFVMHHIISDGWSMDILINELLQFYNSEVTGNTPALQPLRIQYKDYASWQQTQLKGDALEEHKTYWLNQLSGELPVLDLQSDKTRPAIKTYNGETIYFTLNSQVTAGIKTLCKEQGATLFMGLLSAVNTLLYRYTNQEDIIIGSVIAGREHVDLEEQIGFYLNTLALRTQFKGNNSYKEMLQQVKQVTLDGYKHQLYPFDELVDTLELQRDMSRNPLFDVSVVLQNTSANSSGTAYHLDELAVRLFDDAKTNTSKFDLSFDFVEEETAIRSSLTFNNDIYSKESTIRMVAHFEQLLMAIINAPEQAIHELVYLTEKEKQQLLEVFNDTTVGYPEDKTIVDLFEEQVAHTPDNIAVAFEEKTITYRELNEHSNKLAAYLRKNHDIQPDDLVGIQLDRGEWMIVAILGILKSGGAYVPIDTTYPQGRIDYMIQDSNCKLVITAEELTKFKEEATAYAAVNPAATAKPNNLAYVIYTSGTTGNPKGSLIEHKNVVRLFKTDKPLFDFKSSDVWTMFHSYCFDFSVWEMYGALLFGGKVVIVSSMVAKDPEVYLDLLKRESVTILNQTPSAFYNIIKEELKNEATDLTLRYVIFGGEALSPGRLHDWRKKYPKTQLINMYGITETTVHVTYKEITEKEIEKGISNIGTAIPTLNCYVLDPYQNLLPIGVPGELYVGGEGVARGYLNRKELTEQRFIPHLFKEGKLLYRSGDKARLLENGELEYLGRVDDQVKIRGYRIELGEIEHALQEHPEIESAVVITKSMESAEKDLVAYIVGKGSLTIQDLRKYLMIRLPSYMLPGYFVQLDELPLTSNGKIDKKRLPDPAGSGAAGMGMATGVEYVAPRNEIEEKLVEIWQELLGKERIGIKDNFFEIGGHSLKVNRLLTQIKKEYKTELDLKAVFMEPTIEVLADKIANDMWLQNSLVEDADDSNEIKI